MFIYRTLSLFQNFNQLQSNGLQEGLNNTLAGLDYVKDCILKEKPDLVANLGDLFHDSVSIGIRPLHASFLGISKITQACQEVNCKHILIPGNHDMISDSNNTIISSVSVLSGLLEYYDKPKYLKIRKLLNWIITF